MACQENKSKWTSPIAGTVDTTYELRRLFWPEDSYVKLLNPKIV